MGRRLLQKIREMGKYAHGDSSGPIGAFSDVHSISPGRRTFWDYPAFICNCQNFRYQRVCRKRSQDDGDSIRIRIAKIHLLVSQHDILHASGRHGVVCFASLRSHVFDVGQRGIHSDGNTMGMANPIRSTHIRDFGSLLRCCDVG
ncbi:unnamed protein product [Amoebophrya sp. A25]|nr:unnamed protein product [Amoebophrya sp. A25]|eukprot:GSA25T00022083001.1